jgi:hypothetical protein
MLPATLTSDGSMGEETANAPEASQRLTSADLVEVSPLVEGRQAASESIELFTIYNPASGEPLSRFAVVRRRRG